MSFLSDIEKEEEIFIKNFKTMTSKDISLSLDTKELEKYFLSLTDEEKKEYEKEKAYYPFFLNYLEDIKIIHLEDFEFTDESLPPKYHSCLADELIKRKVDINFYCMVRLEKKFTKELLSKMQKAGAKMLSWGYEAGSSRVLSLMNKGIDSRSRYRILKDSASLGIWNHIFICCYIHNGNVDYND